MSDGTGIGWTAVTWNPVVGCTRKSAGCDNCYAVTMTKRLAAMGQAKYLGLVNEGKGHFNGTVRFVPEALSIPLRWRKPRRIFVNSMSDLFHKRLPFEQIDRVFAVMALAQRHVFQVLTKRPARMLEYLTEHAAGGRHVWPAAQLIPMPRGQDKPAPGWPLPNVWLGVSCEDQAAADERIPLLLQCPAAVRWVSAEPLLGPIDLDDLRIHDNQPGTWHFDALQCDVSREDDEPYRGATLDWVVVGGESGRGWRDCDPAWIESIVEQCCAASVPCFVKQDAGPRSGMQARLSDALWAVKQWPQAVAS